MLAVVQARTESARLPNKVQLEVLGKPLLQHLLERLSRARSLDGIVLAIPSSHANDELAELGKQAGVDVFRGSEIDVLDRFVQATEPYDPNVVVRITADCPMIDWEVVDKTVETFTSKQNIRYVGTGLSYPDGLDVQVFKYEDLVWASEKAQDNYDREHVCPMIIRNAGDAVRFIEMSNLEANRLRLTVDYAEDADVVRRVFEHFGHNRFLLEDILELAKSEPEFFTDNSHFVRNEGSLLSANTKLFRRAGHSIPQTGQKLVDYRSNFRFRFGEYAYFRKSLGIQTWDSEGRSFLDFASMGMGKSILGYSNPEIDSAVIAAIGSGNSGPHSIVEEIILAEKLLEIHPWAGSASFVNTWKEGLSLSIRSIESSRPLKSIILIGGHGWLVEILDEFNCIVPAEVVADSWGVVLVDRLVEGLPRAMAWDQEVPDNAVELLAEAEVSGLICDFDPISPSYSGLVKKWLNAARAAGARVVFDETESGFRHVSGSVHLRAQLFPDAVILGGALGNGYETNAVLFCKDADLQPLSGVMNQQRTDRAKLAASLRTLSLREELNSGSAISKIRQQIHAGWTAAASDAGVQIIVKESSSHLSFSVPGYADNFVGKHIWGGMKDRGFLASNFIYPSPLHDCSQLDLYLEEMSKTLESLGSSGMQEVHDE